MLMFHILKIEKKRIKRNKVHRVCREVELNKKQIEVNKLRAVFKTSKYSHSERGGELTQVTFKQSI